MSQSVLYQWLSQEERLKVKLFFYQTLNEFLNIKAKREYATFLKSNLRTPGVHGSIFHKAEKQVDERGEIAFDLVCKELNIHRHSEKWDELLKSSNNENYPLYMAIGKAVALICEKRAEKQKDIPLISSYDYERFAKKFHKKILTLDGSLKIYDFVNKRCSKLQRRLTEQTPYFFPINNTSNTNNAFQEPTLVGRYDFGQPDKNGIISGWMIDHKNINTKK